MLTAAVKPTKQGYRAIVRQDGKAVCECRCNHALRGDRRCLGGPLFDASALSCAYKLMHAMEFQIPNEVDEMMAKYFKKGAYESKQD